MILLLLSALAAGSAPPADSKQCDAKPFTLKKAAPAVSAAPAPQPVKPKVAEKPKPKIVIGCKQPDSKKA